MATISGASGYLNASTLANRRGLPAARSSVLGQGGIGSVDLLEIGRRNAPKGVGLSGRARALNKQYLQSSTSGFNALFSLAVGTTSTIDGLQKTILALRSSLPESRLSRDALALLKDSGGVSKSGTGQKVDTKA